MNLNDKKSFYLHLYCCKKLKKNPLLLKKIECNLNNLNEIHKNTNIIGLNLWNNLIFSNNNLNYIITKILEKNQNGQLLRSNSPLFDLLTNEERIIIIETITTKYREKNGLL